MALLRTFAALAAAAALAGCASEDWDNRFDPDSSAYRAPCAGAPDDLGGACVLWEDFSAGLSRWRVGGPVDGAAPHVEAQSDDGVAGVLALPACAGEETGISLELDEPAAALSLEIVWRPADKAAKVPAVPVVGVTGDAAPETAAAAQPGWFATTIRFSGTGAPTVFGLRCAEAAVLVDQVSLRQ